MNNLSRKEILDLIKKREAKHIITFMMKKYDNKNTWFDIVYKNMDNDNVSELVIKLNKLFWNEVKKGNISKPKLEGEEYE